VKRVAGWALFLLALVWVGVVLHAAAPPTVRWRRTVPLEPDRVAHPAISHDGTRVVVGSRRPDEEHLQVPLQVLDAFSGDEVGHPLDGRAMPQLGRVVLVGGRWLVGIKEQVGRRSLHWADLVGGPEQSPDVPTGGLYTAADGEAAYSEGDPVFTPHVTIPPRLTRVRLRDGAATLLSVRYANLSREGGERVAVMERSGDGSLVITLCEVRGLRGASIPVDDIHYRVSADGGLLVGVTFGGAVEMWDVRDLARPVRRAVARTRPDWPVYRFAPRTGRVAVATTAYDVEVWDGWAGVRQRTITLPAKVNEIDRLSPDGRWALAVTTAHAARPATGLLMDLDTGEVHPRPRSVWFRDPGYLPAAGGGYGLLVRGAVEDEFYEPLTGRSHPLPGRMIAYPDERRAEAGGRQLWFLESFPAPPPASGWWERVLRMLRPPVVQALIGIDWPSRRPLLRLTNAGITSYAVAADGSFVVTAHADGVLRRWDVPPPRPWAWVVGVPLAVGAALLGLRAWLGAKKGFPTRPGRDDPRRRCRALPRPLTAVTSLTQTRRG
jgi:hypothetical protein